MRRILVLAALLVLGTLTLAQQSTSYKLTEHTLNAGGSPVDGVVLVSTRYKITLGAVGESVAGTALGSASYEVDGGFSSAFPPPGEVLELHFADPQTLVWSAERSAGDYNLYRGSFTTLVGMGYGTCHEEEIPLNTTTDGDPVPAGDGYFYLVTVENRLDEEGTKGANSGGDERHGSACP